MEFVRLLLVFLHFLGFAVLLGGWLAQTKAPTKTANTAMLHGAATQLVTGLALVGVNEALDEDLNNARVGVKLVVTLVILGLVVVNRRRERIPTGLYLALGGLTVLNVALAVFWR